MLPLQDPSRADEQFQLLSIMVSKDLCEAHPLFKLLVSLFVGDGCDDGLKHVPERVVTEESQKEASLLFVLAQAALLGAQAVPLLPGCQGLWQIKGWTPELIVPQKACSELFCRACFMRPLARLASPGVSLGSTPFSWKIWIFSSAKLLAGSLSNKKCSSMVRGSPVLARFFLVRADFVKAP